MTIDLHDYITNRMKMSHIYQPVMLKVLLENNGAASIKQIASALLSYGQSQVEYYGIRTKQMVGEVLTNNGVVEPVKSGRRTTGFKLNTEAMSEAQRASLVALCDDNIQDYLSYKQAKQRMDGIEEDAILPTTYTPIELIDLIPTPQRTRRYINTIRKFVNWQSEYNPTKTYYLNHIEDL